MITIRKATIEDLPVLLEFEQGVLRAERPMDRTLKGNPKPTIMTFQTSLEDSMSRTSNS